MLINIQDLCLHEAYGTLETANIKKTILYFLILFSSAALDILGLELLKVLGCLVINHFLGPHLRHMEIPRLGVEPELQLLAYTTATATPDASCVCDLHHSSQ